MINRVFEFINEVSDGNQMIGGALSLWALGVLSYICRGVPAQIHSLARRYLTTELAVASQNASFHSLMRWMEIKGYANRFRRVKLRNGRYGHDKKSTKSVGEGWHIFWYKSRPVFVTMKSEQSIGDYDKEKMTIMKIGRSHTLFDDLITESEEITNREDSNKTVVYRSSGRNGFCRCGAQPIRSLDSVILPAKQKAEILGAFRQFEENEEWYLSNAIPYQFGLMLYGPPGTGKTSLIKALAGHLKKSVSIISADAMSSIGEAMQDMEENSILVIEDIDTSLSVKKRSKKRKKNKDQDKPEDSSVSLESRADVSEFLNSVAGSSLSNVLNAIDGIITIHGRILIATTNHIEKIDDAVLRPGRFDLTIEIGYMTTECFRIAMSRFFPCHTIDLSNVEIAPEVTAAQVQESVLLGASPSELVKKHTTTKENAK